MAATVHETIERLRAVAQDIRRKPYPISDIIPLLTQAADVLESTLTPKDLKDDAPPEELWAEIFRLRAALKGPGDFPTWYEAAVDERVRRVRAENANK